VKVGLDEGLEGEEDEAECSCGGVEAPVVRIGRLFSAVIEALEEENGGEEREKGEKGPVDDEVDVHGRPFAGGWVAGVDRRAQLVSKGGCGDVSDCVGIRLAREEDAGRVWT
jgi:hypothetical protein